MERFDRVSSIISRSIDRFGEVKDSASAELAQIRRQLQQTQASISSVMRRVISRAVENGYLEADASAVVRDGRLVLPVAPMHKRHINGIVHDESASGKTYFIEPAEMVEANNRIREPADGGAPRDNTNIKGNNGFDTTRYRTDDGNISYRRCH